MDILIRDPQNIKQREGLLTYEGEQVILYIETPRRSYEKLEKFPARRPRFHFTFCETIEEMQQNDLFVGRYVATNKQSRYFDIYPYDDEIGDSEEETKEFRLDPCKNCLRKIDYKNYSASGQQRQVEICKNFSLEDLFAEYTSMLRYLSRHWQLILTDKDYPLNWAEISPRFRDENDWKCACCKASFIYNRRFLHVHHKDRIKSNVERSNLISLCAICHSKQPGHQHMRVALPDKRVIEDIRQKQGFAKTCPNCP